MNRRDVPTELQTPQGWTGRWWLADRPRRKRYGRLLWEPAAGALLEIEGNFVDRGASNREQDLDGCIVLGSANGQDITLIDGHWTGLSAHNNGAQVTTRWRFSRIVIGAHVREGNELPVTWIQLEFDSLPVFARILGGIKSIPGGYRHERHAPVAVEIGVGKVSLVSVVRSRSNRFSAELHDDICFDVAPATALTLAEVVDQVQSPLQDLLTFALRSRSRSTILRVKPDRHRGHQEFGYLTILDFGPRTGVPDQPTDAQWYQALFTLEDWNNGLDPFLSNWFRIVDELRLTVDWLLAQDYVGHRYLETEFQESVQACEAYHRVRYAGLNEAIATFAVRRERILQSHTGRDRALVKRGLAHANEYSLERRLVELIDSAAVPMAAHPTVQRFAERVAHTRNVQAHGLPPGGDRHISDPDQLIDAVAMLKWTLRVHLLSELGFSGNSITQIMQRRPESRTFMAEAVPAQNPRQDTAGDEVHTESIFIPG